MQPFPKQASRDSPVGPSDANEPTLQPLSVMNVIVRCTVIALVAWSVASSLSAFPCSLSYFNELAGGPRHGHLHLLGSNVEWGQDLLHLRRWMDEHPRARPMYVYVTGFYDPSDLGLECLDLREPAVQRQWRDRPRNLEGWYAVGVNDLRRRGLLGDTAGRPLSDAEDFLSLALREQSPITRIGYSIYLYHVSDATLQRQWIRNNH